MSSNPIKSSVAAAIGLPAAGANAAAATPQSGANNIKSTLAKDVLVTVYTPGKGDTEADRKMQGGVKDMRGNSLMPHTLEQYLAGKSAFVAVAANRGVKYGTDIKIKFSDLKMDNLPIAPQVKAQIAKDNGLITAKVVDTGSPKYFPNLGGKINHIDVASEQRKPEMLNAKLGKKADIMTA